MPVTAGATSTEANLNDTTPAAPAGSVNVKWQAGSPYTDPNDANFEVRDISAYVPAPTWVSEEQVAGTADGVNATFTVANVPLAGTFKLFSASGLRLRSTVAYTIAGSTITMQAGYIPANSGEKPYADYAH